MRCLALACLAFAASTGYAEYPLITEDTNTVGAGRWQLEGTSEIAKDAVTGERTATDTFALSYGLAGQADLQLVVPWHRARTDGVGDVLLGVKWRFLERGPFSLGVKPGVALPAGDAQEGRGTGEANWGVTLIGSYESGALALHADARYRRNRNEIGERQSLRQLSGGLLYQVGSVKLVVDAAFDTSPDPAIDRAERYAVLGIVWPVHRDFGVAIGWKKGGGGATLEEALLLGAAVRW